MCRVWNLIRALTVVVSLAGVGLLGQTRTAPILLIVNSSATNPFDRYLGEILRAEGLGPFSTVELSSLSSSVLKSAPLVVLAETPLSAQQASLIRDYVAAGGRLVAMRPDAQILATVGVVDREPGGGERYLVIDTATPAGNGFPATTLPLVGPVEHYRLAPGAASIATLYMDSATPTTYPAVIRSGRTVAWVYDLARSVVYTRQGNPVNAGIDRDGQPPIRSTDLFYRAIDLDRVSLPHVDFQMRLFSRLIADLLADALPLPRLWYFPDAGRTLLVVTADSHVHDEQAARQQIASIEARGGRLSMYVSRYVPHPTAAEAALWRANGHEFGLHPYGAADEVSLESGFRTAANWFNTKGPGRPGRTARIHQIEWTSWVGPAQIEAKYRIGLDTSFYTWGPAVKYPDGHQAHGFINGSGLPMRFVDETGTIIPVYQQVTSIIDEQLVVGDDSEHLSPAAALAVTRQMIDDSQAGGYSALVAQFHTDSYSWGEVLPWAEGTLDYAKSLEIPIWSAERWLTYVEARAATQLADLAWSAPSMSFMVTVPANAEPQSLALPATYADRGVAALIVDGRAVTPVTKTTTGRLAIFFNVGPGTHTVTATYSAAIAPANRPPVVVTDSATVAQGGTVTIPVLANDSDPDNDPLTVTAVTQGARGTAAVSPDKTVRYTAGPVCGPDRFTYAISDGHGGTATGAVNVSIQCTAGQVTHSSTTDFGQCGVFEGTTLTMVRDGEVRLSGAFGDDYGAARLDPARWVAGTWSGGAFTPAPSAGVLSVASPGGAFVRSLTPLRITTLETTARFSGASWEHIGWGALDLSGPYLLFSTANTTTNLHARTSTDGKSEQRTDLGPIPPGFHIYRIERVAQSPASDVITYYVDGVQRAQHTVTSIPPLYVYQSHNGGASPTLDIERLSVYPPYGTKGTYRSCTIDATGPVTWTSVTLNAAIPAGSTLEVSTRSSADAQSWSAWSEPLAASGGAIVSPPGRFLQYRLGFRSGSSSNSPVVESVTVAHSLAPPAARSIPPPAPR